MQTGENIPVEVFISTMPASDCPFAIAVASQKVEDFILGCTKALEFYGGVPRTIITDNLKAAVIKADRYMPEVNKVFEDFCNHYGTVHVPARARKPRDKANVENDVRIIYHHIYADLRDQVFLSMDSLNEALSAKTEESSIAVAIYLAISINHFPSSFFISFVSECKDSNCYLDYKM